MHDFCPLCDRIHKKATVPSDVIFSDKFVFLEHSQETSIPGYCILSPQRHVTHLGGLAQDELFSLTQVMASVNNILLNQPEIEKVYLLSFGEVVPHFHYHIFPRYSWMAKIKACYTGNGLDGVKLVSYAREHYRVPSDQDSSAILSISTHIKACLQLLD